MDEFTDFNDNPVYDINKLSAERNRRLNRYRNRQAEEPQELFPEINFTLTNTFWGNSWSCNDRIKVRKGAGLKTSINITSSHTLSEVWDCRVIFYNSIEDHNIYLRSLDKDITVQIHNNKFTCNSDDSYSLSGQISEKVTV
jgi:hypothetical protein